MSDNGTMSNIKPHERVFLELLSQTIKDTDAVLRQVLAEMGITSVFITIEEVGKAGRITSVDIGPSPWDTDFMLDGEIILRRRVEDEGGSTVYMVKDQKGTRH